MRMFSSCLLTALMMLTSVTDLRADDAIPEQPEPRWWKGNIHTHSLWSDGNDFPEMIAEWYRVRDYNFLALSDHNILSNGMRWMKVADVQRRGGPDALAKYQQRFGGGWVELRDTDGVSEVRLKPLDEFRALVEERGKFLMIQGEEVTDKAEGKPVHMNVTNLQTLLQPLGGKTITETITANLRAAEDQAARQGREVLVHLNHPNFGLAVTAEELAAVVAERFFEVYNGHPGVKHLGDGQHPGVEQMWDIANTIRLGHLNAPPLYGVATDDSHEYHGKPGSRPGRGWVMVRSRYLTPEQIVKAMKAGDFYCSSGVTLEEVGYDSSQRRLQVRISPREGAKHTTQFIGTLKKYDDRSEPRTDKEGQEIRATRRYSADVGRVLATVEGDAASYQLTGAELYVRAVVTSTLPPQDPSFAEQKQQAWTQPVVP